MFQFRPFFIVLVFTSFFCGVQADEIADLVNRLTARNTAVVSLTEINEKNRSAVISYANAVASGKVMGNSVGARILLLRLGDPTFIAKLMEEYRAYDTADVPGIMFCVERAGQPLLATEFARDLDSPHPPGTGNSRGTCVLIPSREFCSAHLALHSIMGSNEFKSKVKSWARLRLEQGAKPDYLEAVKQWWRKNRFYFEQKKYQEVQPGTLWPESISDQK
jgi:hypothetical protein